MKSDKLKLILSMSIFGTIGLVRRYIPYPSGFIALVRGIIGTLFLLIVRMIKKEKLPVNALKMHGVPLCISGILLGINWILLFEAYRYTTVSVATVCYYMAPVFVILASPIVLHEKLTAKKGICSLAAVLGMVLVSGITETGLSGMTGVLCGLGAAAAYAAIMLINKRIDGIGSDDRTIFQLGIAAVALLPYVLLTTDVFSLKFTLFPVAMLMIAGVVHTGVAFALFFGSIRDVPAQAVALLSYIDPIVAVLLSAFVLKEKLSLPAAVGVITVICSAMFSEIEFKTIRPCANADK